MENSLAIANYFVDKAAGNVRLNAEPRMAGLRQIQRRPAVRLTHQKDTPWDITYNRLGGKEIRSFPIATDLIQSHYKSYQMEPDLATIGEHIQIRENDSIAKKEQKEDDDRYSKLCVENNGG